MPDDLDERLEHQKPYDIPTDMLAAVETVCQTLLAPAQEGAVLDGFGDVDCAQGRHAFMVGQGAGDLEDAVEGPGGEPQALKGVFEESLACAVQPAGGGAGLPGSWRR